MSESTRKTRPLLVSREQARQLADWAENSMLVPRVARIYKQGHFAYYTNDHIAVRWDVEGLDLPDGSWIDLVPYVPGEFGVESDTLTNMADWSKVADEDDYWDLKDAKRWRKPDECPMRDCEQYFTRVRASVSFVALHKPLLTGLCLVVTGHEYGEVAVAPTREDGSGPWWVMGHDSRVAGLCVQFSRFYSSEDDMPEANQEKKEEGKQ